MSRKRARPSKSRTRVAPDGDPSWAVVCKPLLLHLLKSPSTNAELAVWRKTQRVTAAELVQMLAWGENRKVLLYRDGVWGTIRSFR